MSSQSQDSVGQPPLKKQKIHATQHDTQEEVFRLSQSLTSSNKSPTASQLCKTVIKKGDKIERRVDLLLRTLTQKQEPILVMGSGVAIQKLVSIVEIVKLRLVEQHKEKFEQFNRVDMFEKVVKQNELLDKKVLTPVFYCFLRPVVDGPLDDDLKSWTKQTI